MRTKGSAGRSDLRFSTAWFNYGVELPPELLSEELPDEPPEELLEGSDDPPELEPPLWEPDGDSDPPVELPLELPDTPKCELTRWLQPDWLISDQLPLLSVGADCSLLLSTESVKLWLPLPMLDAIDEPALELWSRDHGTGISLPLLELLEPDP